MVEKKITSRAKVIKDSSAIPATTAVSEGGGGLGTTARNGKRDGFSATWSKRRTAAVESEGGKAGQDSEKKKTDRRY